MSMRINQIVICIDVFQTFRKFSTFDNLFTKFQSEIKKNFI